VWKGDRSARTISTAESSTVAAGTQLHSGAETPCAPGWSAAEEAAHSSRAPPGAGLFSPSRGGGSRSASTGWSDLASEILSTCGGSQGLEEGLSVSAFGRFSGSVSWRSSDFRRRKYLLPQAQQASLCPGHRSAGWFPAAARGGEQPDHAVELCRLGGDGAGIDWDAVIIEGPLPQHAILSFWRQRWCVLARVLGEWELRIYQDKAASRSAAAAPLWRGKARELALVPDAGGQPSTLTCVDLNTGEPVLALRVLAGDQFEQLVAWKLWCAALQASGLATDDELA